MSVLGWILKLIAAVIVWAIVALLLQFLGGLFSTVSQTQIQYLGNFLMKSAGLIGFLVGAAYFVWGYFPTERFPR